MTNIERAFEAAKQAEDAAKAFDGIEDEHPHAEEFQSYYRDRATMYAQVAQAWASLANAQANESRSIDPRDRL